MQKNGLKLGWIFALALQASGCVTHKEALNDVCMAGDDYRVSGLAGFSTGRHFDDDCGEGKMLSALVNMRDARGQIKPEAAFIVVEAYNRIEKTEDTENRLKFIGFWLGRHGTTIQELRKLVNTPDSRDKPCNSNGLVYSCQ